MNTMPTKLPGLFTALLGCVGVVSAAQVTLTIREAGRAEPLPARVHLNDDPFVRQYLNESLNK